MTEITSLWTSLIEASGLSKEEKHELRQIAESISRHDEWMSFEALLRAMDPSQYVLFFGDGEWILVSPWGFQGSSFVKYNRHNGERLPFVNELMPSRFEVSDQELRSFFCMLELALFKLLELHEVSAVAGRDFDKLTLGSLRKVLRKSSLLTDQALDILDKIIETRNEFNHSMKSVNEISYCRQKLRVSHSSMYVPWENSDDTVRRFFVDDAFFVTEEIVCAYRKQQHKLVEGKILLDFLRGDIGLPRFDGELTWRHRDCALEEKHWLEHQARK